MTQKALNNLLSDFDIDNLDMFELRMYEHHIKYMPKEEAIQILINTVEGDFSQLSDGLRDIAEIQELQNKTHDKE